MRPKHDGEMGSHYGEWMPQPYPLKLNLGSGTHPWGPPWVNVDAWEEMPMIDVVADIRRLPFPDDSASHVYMGHVLEHLEEDDVPVALAEVRRVLRDDGELMVVGPDLDRAKVIAPSMVSAIWPGAAGEGLGGHKWPSTEKKTVELLVESRFTTVTIPVETVPEFWPCPNRVGWQFAIRCAP